VRFTTTPIWVFLLVTLGAVPSVSQEPSTSKPAVNAGAPSTPTGAPTPTLTADQVINRIVEGEAQLIHLLRNFRPVVETYLQNMQPDEELGMVPKGDEYFLGRLDFARGVGEESYLEHGHIPQFLRKIKGAYALRYSPAELSRAVLVDENLNRERYKFTFLRRETLGDVRCLLFKLEPRGEASGSRFLGRIWVEDEDFKIVRFNGTYVPHPRSRPSLHFDSWRLNLLPKTWLPAYIYSEESDEETKVRQKIRYRAQTRLWGYDLEHAGDHREYQQTLAADPIFLPGQHEASTNLSPILSEGQFPYSTEEVIVERLQLAGVMAPDGPVDRVLEQVVTNLIITNNIDNLPGVHCRVLLTTPFETFTIGHTIVVSRGLLDVLPNEASLAGILAHELAHMLLGHSTANSAGFNDRMFIADEKVLQAMNFHRDSTEEQAADKKALELLRRSPYKDHLGEAGLFFSMLKSRGLELPKLIQPQLGSAWATGDETRMTGLEALSPKLEMNRTDQIAALPLGGRIKLDPWSDRIELMKPAAIALQNPREKMPLEVTPFFPHLVRYDPDGAAGHGNPQAQQ
jgi:Peptidase family M48